MQREWDRRWRRKQALKAKLFDEMMGRKPIIECAGAAAASLEAEFVSGYLSAHPWRGYMTDIALIFGWFDGRMVDVIVGDPGDDFSGMLGARLEAVCQAALNELYPPTDTPNPKSLIAEAAAVTARMREAGIWTGPSR